MGSLLSAALLVDGQHAAHADAFIIAQCARTQKHDKTHGKLVSETAGAATPFTTPNDTQSISLRSEQ
jgi:hypothetical protein